MTGRTSIAAALAAALMATSTGGLAQDTGDPAAGEKVFRKCRACHAVEPGKHGMGPSLHGVVGRKIASADGFEYSDAMTVFAETHADGWTPELLATFLEQPRKVVDGTKMVFAGLRDAQDRADVVAYLQSLR